MNVRRASPQDAVAASQTIHDALSTNRAEYSEDVISELREHYDAQYLRSLIDRETVFVAETDQIIGTARVSGDEIKMVFVSPHAQGQGVGSALMRAAERRVAQQGFSEVRLRSSLTATRFYAKRGYEELGSVSDERFGAGVQMRKSL